MRRTLAICRKELQMYFYSPVSYVAFALYFLITSAFFYFQFLGNQVVDVRMIFGYMVTIFLFIIPLLTMRLISEELRQGTDELLFTSPASITELVMGKYLAAITVQLLLLAGTLIYPLILAQFGDLDLPVMWLSYLSMFLLGSAMMAVGLFASSLSSHQMLSGIAAFCFILLLWMLDWAGESLFEGAKDWIYDFSITGRLSNFQKGVFDLSDVTFYLTFIIMFLVISIQVLGRKRWR